MSDIMSILSIRTHGEDFDLNLEGERCSTAMAKCLLQRPRLYRLNRMRRTARGYTFDEHIQLGIDYPGFAYGVLALEEDSYICYKEFFKDTIEIIRGPIVGEGGGGCCYGSSTTTAPTGAPTGRIDLLRHLGDLPITESGIKGDFCEDAMLRAGPEICGEVDNGYRLTSMSLDSSKNIACINFSPKISRAERRKVYEIVLVSVIPSIFPTYDGIASCSETTPVRPPHTHFMTCSGCARDWPDSRSIFNANGITIHVNTQDHIRLIVEESENHRIYGDSDMSSDSGGENNATNSSEATHSVCGRGGGGGGGVADSTPIPAMNAMNVVQRYLACEQQIEEALKGSNLCYAYDPEFGYLTACPSTLGAVWCKATLTLIYLPQGNGDHINRLSDIEKAYSFTISESSATLNTDSTGNNSTHAHTATAKPANVGTQSSSPGGVITAAIQALADRLAPNIPSAATRTSNIVNNQNTTADQIRLPATEHGKDGQHLPPMHGAASPPVAAAITSVASPREYCVSAQPPVGMSRLACIQMFLTGLDSLIALDKEIGVWVYDYNNSIQLLQQQQQQQQQLLREKEEEERRARASSAVVDVVGGRHDTSADDYSLTTVAAPFPSDSVDTDTWTTAVGESKEREKASRCDDADDEEDEDEMHIDTPHSNNTTHDHHTNLSSATFSQQQQQQQATGLGTQGTGIHISPIDPQDRTVSFSATGEAPKSPDSRPSSSNNSPLRVVSPGKQFLPKSPSRRHRRHHHRDRERDEEGEEEDTSSRRRGLWQEQEEDDEDEEEEERVMRGEESKFAPSPTDAGGERSRWGVPVPMNVFSDHWRDPTTAGTQMNTPHHHHRHSGGGHSVSVSTSKKQSQSSTTTAILQGQLDGGGGECGPGDPTRWAICWCCAEASPSNAGMLADIHVFDPSVAASMDDKKVVSSPLAEVQRGVRDSKSSSPRAGNRGVVIAGRESKESSLQKKGSDSPFDYTSHGKQLAADSDDTDTVNNKGFRLGDRGKGNKGGRDDQTKTKADTAAGVGGGRSLLSRISAALHRLSTRIRGGGSVDSAYGSPRRSSVTSNMTYPNESGFSLSYSRSAGGGGRRRGDSSHRREGEEGDSDDDDDGDDDQFDDLHPSSDRDLLPQQQGDSGRIESPMGHHYHHYTGSYSHNHRNRTRDNDQASSVANQQYSDAVSDQSAIEMQQQVVQQEQLVQQNQQQEQQQELCQCIISMSLGSDFPIFPRGTTSLLARYLTPDMYDRLQHYRTWSGCSLADLILPGTENPLLPIGVIAGDAECYEVYHELLDPIIEKLHKFKPGTSKVTHDLSPLKLGGLLTIDPEYVRSVTIQGTRNVRSFALAPRLSRQDRCKLENILRLALEKLSVPAKGEYFPLNSLSAAQIADLKEKGVLFKKPKEGSSLYVSSAARDWPDGRGIFISKDLYVWVNQGDHVRLISTSAGFDMINAFERWSTVVMLLQALLGRVNSFLSVAADATASAAATVDTPTSPLMHTTSNSSTSQQRLRSSRDDSSSSAYKNGDDDQPVTRRRSASGATAAITSERRRSLSEPPSMANIINTQGSGGGGGGGGAGRSQRGAPDQQLQHQQQQQQEVAEEKEKGEKEGYSFEHSDTLGYISCCPSNLGTSLYAVMTVYLPNLSRYEDCLLTLCGSMGLRAKPSRLGMASLTAAAGDTVDVQSVAMVDHNHNDHMQDDVMAGAEGATASGATTGTGTATGAGAGGGVGGNNNSSSMISRNISAVSVGPGVGAAGGTPATAAARSRTPTFCIGDEDGGVAFCAATPSAAALMLKKDRVSRAAGILNYGGGYFDISNKDCMGATEVQLVQRVIDSVAALIEIDKKVQDGANVEEFLPPVKTEVPQLPQPTHIQYPLD